MSEPLLGPDQRYSVVLEVLATSDGRTYEKHEADFGLPVSHLGGQATLRTARVLLGEACSVTLGLGESGLTVQEIRPIGARHLVLTGHVSAGATAPDWMPQESTYLLFQGDRTAARAIRDRYTPFQGLTDEPASGDDEKTTLDRLAVAIGRSVARANTTLARGRHDAGVAIVTQVTVRVAVDRTDVEDGRIFLTLGQPGAGGGGPFVELTMNTVPPADAEGEGPALETAPGGDAVARIGQPTGFGTAAVGRQGVVTGR